MSLDEQVATGDHLQRADVLPRHVVHELHAHVTDVVERRNEQAAEGGGGRAGGGGGGGRKRKLVVW